MHYLTQGIAILLTIFILIIWSVHKRTGTFNESVFTLLIFACLISSALDIACQFAIAPYPIQTSDFKILLTIKVYLASTVFYLYAMGLYVDRKISTVDKTRSKSKLWLIICAVCGLIICAVPVGYSFHPDCSTISEISGISEFIQAPFLQMLIMVLMCSLLIFVILINKKYLIKWSRFVFAVWIALYALSFVFQRATIEVYHLPVVSIVMAVGIMFLFLCEENPGSSYSYDTNSFYYETLKKYVQTVISKQLNQSCMMINIRIKNLDNLEYVKNIQKNLIDDKKNKNLKFYQGVTNEIYVVSNNPEELEYIKESVKKQVAKIEESNIQIKLFVSLIIFPDVKAAKSYKTLRSIFDTYRLASINEADSYSEIIITEDIIVDYKDTFARVEQIDYAIKKGDIFVDYQNIINTMDDGVYVEAYANIKLEDGHILSTKDYYELAVKYNLLKEIRIVKFQNVKGTINKVVANKNNKLKYVFLHTSVQELEIERYFEEYIKAFDYNDLILCKTCVEITNIDMIANKDVLLRNIQELQKHGVKFAIAGFGKGEANLNYFVDLPIDFVKFDDSMSKNALSNKKALSIIKDIADLAHSLSFDVIIVGDDEKNVLDIAEKCGVYLSIVQTVAKYDDETFINKSLEGGNDK